MALIIVDGYRSKCDAVYSIWFLLCKVFKKFGALVESSFTGNHHLIVY